MKFSFRGLACVAVTQVLLSSIVFCREDGGGLGLENDGFSLWPFFFKIYLEQGVWCESLEVKISICLDPKDGPI